MPLSAVAAAAIFWNAWRSHGRLPLRYSSFLIATTLVSPAFDGVRPRLARPGVASVRGLARRELDALARASARRAPLPCHGRDDARPARERCPRATVGALALRGTRVDFWVGRRRLAPPEFAEAASGDMKPPRLSPSSASRRTWAGDGTVLTASLRENSQSPWCEHGPDRLAHRAGAVPAGKRPCWPRHEAPITVDGPAGHQKEHHVHTACGAYV